MKKLAFALILFPGAAFAGGMPQLDFGNKLLLAQVVWGAIIFTGFYLLVSRWGLPQVGAVLEMRADAIAADLEQARIAKEKSDRAVAELNEARRLAFAESQAAVAAASTKAKDAAAALTAEVNAKLDRQLAEAEAQINAARADAMGALRGIAGETAQAIIGRLTGYSVNANAVDAAVGAALAERGLA